MNRTSCNIETHRLVELLPYTNRLVVRTSHNKLPVIADCQGPNLAMVSLEFLYELELVTVPIFEHFVFADGPEVMCRLALSLTCVVPLKRNLHDTLVMCKDGFMAVTEVEAPYLDVLVGRTGNNELGIVGDIHG